MMTFLEGNLLDSQAEALVNTVNEVGVMGKGIALMFSESFPANTDAYSAACQAGLVKVGRVFVTENKTLVGPRWIINFPTKRHWRNPSKIEWIRDGLDNLVEVVSRLHIRSIALPPLGCGNGGLDWHDVRLLIEETLSALHDVDVQVFVPTQKYQNTPKAEGVSALTPARALITELMRRYSILGFDCTVLEIQKLAWFLSKGLKTLKIDDPLKFKFKAERYGPYTDRLRHLLNHLDGSYIHCNKRLSDAGPLDLLWADPNRKLAVSEYLRDSKMSKYMTALEWTAQLIDGFESPFGMELLSTVDWLLSEQHIAPSVPSIKKGIREWPAGKQAAERKEAIFNDRVLGIALERLTNLPALNEGPLFQQIAT